MPIPVAIVDDEPLARRKLRHFFMELPEYRVCGEAGDGPSALGLLRETRPLLLCLDISLPGMSGLEVLRQARSEAAVIFTTAFDRFAVSAFELAAVDYLLKPFSRDRFLAALRRARVWITAAAGLPPAERIATVGDGSYLTQLFVRNEAGAVPVRAATVRYFEANDDSVLVHAGEARFRLGVTLSALEDRLDPAMFSRIHRRLIVNLDHVAAIVPATGSRLAARLKDGTELPVSRQRARLFRTPGR